MARQDDTCDHGIAQIARTTLHFPQGRQNSRLLRGFGIERKDLLIHAGKNFIESLTEKIPTLAAGHNPQPYSNLKNRNSRYPKRQPRLPINPSDYPWIW